MNLIDGIGGAFLFSNNPKQLAEWYRDNLGISVQESPEYKSFYATFEYRDLTGLDHENDSVGHFIYRARH
jgi:hypothetical protein